MSENLNAGDYSKSHISDIPADINSKEYKFYDKTIPKFPGQATYIYSFAENKMIYASGWHDVLGVNDSEVSMLTIVMSTAPRFMKFSNELNDKALMFIQSKTDELEDYSFTIELEKLHKNGTNTPVFSRVGVHKATNGKVEQIIGISQIVTTLKFGKVMQYAAYGPEKSKFEENLNKELFEYIAISRKEKEALELAVLGFSFKEIAHKLGVSQSAIEKRIIPLYKRFDVKSLPHLVSFAKDNQVI